ncbi:MAG: CoA pyrophosphatase [Candidatus Lambdaproteobacteria bacterium]|nr:CoA pyrophosphatase [Candidatus Lambdaproteobacteria bacterium]
MLTIDQIRSALHKTPHDPLPFERGPSWASVAMIFGENGKGLEVLFIKRAERQGDPWSGHVAFPGGRASPRDADASTVAERETLEEIGLTLQRTQRVAPLPELPVRRNDVHVSLTLSPFVYHIGPKRDDMRLNHEVDQVFWVPLAHLFDAANTARVEFVRNGEELSFPGVRYERNIIWGLTLRVLGVFAERLERKLPALHA